MVMVLGLGVLAFGQFTGSWDMSISIDPGATQAGDLFMDLTTSLAVDYAVAGWAFASSSTFDTIGWSAQSFTAAGVLGAFTFDAAMYFLPRTVLTAEYIYAAFPQTWSTTAGSIAARNAVWYYCWWMDDDYLTETYGADFDYLTAAGSVSIAGLSFEGFFYLEGYAGDAAAAPVAFFVNETTHYAVQTGGDTAHVLLDSRTPTTLGSGFRFTASGSVGDMTISSYTYFSLTEAWSEVTCGQALTKDGTFTVDGCELGFTETYLHIDGFAFGCATFEVGLDITCAGFNWVSFKASGLDLGLGWAPLVADFQVTFGTISKTVALCFDFTAVETTCFTFGSTLDYSGTAISGITIDSVTLAHEWNGISFSSTTLFDSVSSTVTDDANQVSILAPVTGMTGTATAGTCCADAVAGDAIASIATSAYDVISSGYWEPYCYFTEKYDIWEYFTISSEGDGCCGGAFTFDVTVSFGTKKTLKAMAWDYQFVPVAGTSSPLEAYAYGSGGTYAWQLFLGWLEAGETTTVAAVTGGADANLDGMVDAIVHVADEDAAEQLVIDALYRDATQDQLFQWVSSVIDVSYGLSSTWSLTFGLDIDVYGWNGLDFGFDFAF